MRVLADDRACIAGAVVRAGAVRARTDARGRAAVLVRPRRAGRLAIRVRTRACGSARVGIPVLRP
jgi:hypothetical protein